MKNNFEIDINPRKILKSRGLNDGGGAQMLLAERIRKYSFKYVPYKTGALFKSQKVLPKGKGLSSDVPYARYQYYGRSVNGKPLNYRGAPQRGAFWVLRLWAAEGQTILRQLKEYFAHMGK